MTLANILTAHCGLYQKFENQVHLSNWWGSATSRLQEWHIILDEHYNPVCIRRSSLMSYSSIYTHNPVPKTDNEFLDAWSLTTILGWLLNCRQVHQLVEISLRISSENQLTDLQYFRKGASHYRIKQWTQDFFVIQQMSFTGWDGGNITIFLFARHLQDPARVLRSVKGKAKPAPSRALVPQDASTREYKYEVCDRSPAPSSHVTSIHSFSSNGFCNFCFSHTRWNKAGGAMWNSKGELHIPHQQGWAKNHTRSGVTGWPLVASRFSNRFTEKPLRRR